MRYLFCLLLGLLLALPAHAFENFITRDGHQLKDGEQVFRFAGIHAPELHRIEDDVRGVCKADQRGWGQYFKWPTAEEQENWVQALVGTGHKAMRIYTLSVQQEYDAVCGREVHIMAPAKPDGPVQLNETAMQVYDRLIALADEHGLRLILPFIDHWQWWGGRQQLAAFYGEKEDDFYDVNSKTYTAYLGLIELVINRRNTITGRRYFDEKAIMAWETGNELKLSTPEFVRRTAQHIKRLAPRQLVVDGTYLNLLPSSLDDPNVDIISNHYYTNAGNNTPATVAKDLTFIGGKKVYLIGEFGLAPHASINEIMQAAVHTEVNGAQAAGALVWGFRGHRHDGGFYWHKEGDTDHYSYHLPGFPEGAANQEQEVVALVRTAQAQMAGLKSPVKLARPIAPVLRAVLEDRKIRFMGAPLGRTYRIERAKHGSGKWKVLIDNLSDGRNRFDPSTDTLYQDTEALPIGAKFDYRVIAKNESGESPPSNVQSVTIGTSSATE